MSEGTVVRRGTAEDGGALRFYAKVGFEEAGRLWAYELSPA
ncbi:MAG: hypothetical protein ACE5JJ_11765 [Nitrospinota bacterium]